MIKPDLPYLTPEVINDIAQHCLSRWPEEACGIIDGDRFLPLDNRHETPTNDFRIIDPRYDLSVVTKRVKMIIHSHPNGQTCPSVSDMRGQIETGVPWGVVVMAPDAAGKPVIRDWFIFGDTDVIPPLKEREFRHGVFDCYNLARDVYRVHKGFTLPQLPRDDVWWFKGQNILVENFEQFGFERVSLHEIAPFDAVMCMVGAKVVNHCGVYMGNGLVMHHMCDRLSKEEPIDRYARFITHVLRYKG